MNEVPRPLLQPSLSPANVDPCLIAQRLERLPRRTQQVLLLNRLERLDFAQIATRLGLSCDCVERLMLQALHATLPASGPVTTQACRWYIRLQNPSASACERIDFRRWLDACPAHAQAFHETELQWRRLLAPAQALGLHGRYRQGRAALTLGGCSLAIGLGATLLLAFGLWA